MEYRNLGRSGLKVSSLTLGSATFGGMGSMGDTPIEDATRQVDMCIEAGVNLLDTANAYASGRSETMVGEILSANGRREKMMIATKVRGGTGEGPNDRGLSRHHILAACEASLKRLKTDHIDLYQLHGWDGQTPIDETMEALDRLVDDGKVRYIGCSNFSGWHIASALAASAASGGARFAAQQICYTLYSREAERELLPHGMHSGMGTLVFSPTVGGLLSGKFRRGETPEDSRWLRGWNEPPNVDEARLYDILDVLFEIAETRSDSVARVAIAWILTRPTVTSVILGGRTHEQISENLGAAELVLTTAELDRLEQVSRLTLPYPYWHQAKNAKDRLGEIDRVFLGPYLAG